MSRARASTLYIIAAFSATALLVIVLLALQWRSFGNVEQTAELVTRTLRAESELTAFGNRIRDAETGQRGYLLTGIPAYLAPYRSAAREAPREIANLKDLLADNPDQLRRVARLDTLSAAKLAELETTVKLANEGDRDSALEVVRTNVGDSLMRSIRLVLRDAVRAEDSLLTASETRLEGAFASRNALSAVLSIALAVMLTMVVFVLRRLRKYQDLITLCAWSKAVNYEGEWLSFEEYLRRRFGLSATHGISPEALADLEAKLDEKQ